ERLELRGDGSPARNGLPSLPSGPPLVDWHGPQRPTFEESTHARSFAPTPAWHPLRVPSRALVLVARPHCGGGRWGGWRRSEGERALGVALRWPRHRSGRSRARLAKPL